MPAGCAGTDSALRDRLRSLPIARWAPLAGRITADVVKQAWTIALLFGLGAILGFRVTTGFGGVLGAFAIVLAFSLAFSWISVLVGMVSEPDKVMIFGFAVLFPLTFVSNAFVQTSTMPGWMQTWVNINPVSILADACRGLLVGGPSTPRSLGTGAPCCCSCATAGGCWSRRRPRTRARWARWRGGTPAWSPCWPGTPGS